MAVIAKACAQRAGPVVVDEPTAALSGPEIARLFEIILKLKRDGVAIVYVSHRLHEIFEIADRITVLRDGRKVGELAPAATSVNELVHMMVGREVSTTYRQKFCDEPGAPVLEVDDLSSQN